MAEETKETKVSFKEKFKKTLPWILGGIGTIGGSILAYKLGKFNAKYQQNLKDDDAINGYLLDRVKDLREGGHVGVGVIDRGDNEIYAELVLCDKKPEWFDDSYELTTESSFTELVTSTSTKK